MRDVSISFRLVVGFAASDLRSLGAAAVFSPINEYAIRSFASCDNEVFAVRCIVAGIMTIASSTGIMIAAIP